MGQDYWQPAPNLLSKLIGFGIWRNTKKIVGYWNFAKTMMELGEQIGAIIKINFLDLVLD